MEREGRRCPQERQLWHDNIIIVMPAVLSVIGRRCRTPVLNAWKSLDKQTEKKNSIALTCQLSSQERTINTAHCLVWLSGYALVTGVVLLFATCHCSTHIRRRYSRKIDETISCTRVATVR